MILGLNNCRISCRVVCVRTLNIPIFHAIHHRTPWEIIKLRWKMHTHLESTAGRHSNGFDASVLLESDTKTGCQAEGRMRIGLEA